MPDVRIFISYDMDHDTELCDRLLEQSLHGGSGFSIMGRTEMSSDPGGERVRRRIRAADEVIFVCGEHTDESVRTSAELRIAQEEEKPYFLLWGRREVMCKRPESAKANDAMYSWTDQVLRNQIDFVMRKAVPREIPESCKRATPRPAPTTGD